VGIPVFLGLEGITTGIQLMHSLAEVSAILAGETNPLTLWERWSRFLEASGRFVIEVCAALLTIAIVQRASHTTHPRGNCSPRCREGLPCPLEVK
jgi:hypothetical protein